MLMKAKQDLKDHYNATPKSMKPFFKSTSYQREIANEVALKKTCEFCKKHNRRRQQNSHTEQNCFCGDKPGWKKLKSANKADESHYVAFHDSGSTPRSYFKDMPVNCKRSNGYVKTADESVVPIEGVGSVKFGNMELQNVAYVPSFTKNLVSGIQIMQQGFKQGIENGCLKIYKDEELVATGQYDETTGILKMDRIVPHSSNFAHSTVLQNRLVHPVDKLLKGTLGEEDEGLKLTLAVEDSFDCELCSPAKTRKSNWY